MARRFAQMIRLNASSSKILFRYYGLEFRQKRVRSGRQSCFPRAAGLQRCRERVYQAVADAPCTGSCRCSRTFPCASERFSAAPPAVAALKNTRLAGVKDSLSPVVAAFKHSQLAGVTDCLRASAGDLPE
eukprot:2361177-Pleurochrysis_carterae.AAC.3